VNPLDQRQRQIALAAAGVAVVVFLAIWIPQLGSHVGKGQTTPLLALISGIILAGLLASSLLINKRYIVGLAALFLAFIGPWGKYPLLAVPYAGLAGWLVITAGRQAREEAAMKREASGDSPGAPARGGGGTSSRSSGGSAGARPRGGGFLRRGQRDETPARRKPPSASRRYTPPKS
jgi:hypothetical protein